MNITRENVDALNAVVKINVEKADYQPKLEDSLKNLRKQVDMKGFRKGMVPANLIKKKFGNQVLAEELNKLIDESLNKYLEENRIRILGNPLPKDQENQQIDVDNPQDYEFQYELGLSPDFEVKGLEKGTKVPFYKIKVDKSLIDEEVDRLRKRMGKMSNPEDSSLQDDDVAYVELRELDADGKVKEGGVSNDTAIAMDMITDEGTTAAMKKLKIGESATVDIFKMTDKSRHDAAHHFLNIHEEDASPVGDKFQLTLKKINRVEAAEVNQDFFDQVFGQGVVNSEEEFRKRIEDELTNVFGEESNRRLNYDIKKKVLELNKVALPDDFLKRWIQRTNEKPVTAEQIEEEYSAFAEGIKWNLIVDRVGRANNLEISKEEIEQHTKDSIIRQFGGSMGMLNDEQLTNWSNTMLQNRDHVQRTYEHLMDSKLFTIIRNQVSVEEKEITLDEFKKLN